MREQINYEIPIEWHENRKKHLCPVCAKPKTEFTKNMRVYCSKECKDIYLSKIITWSELREKAINLYGKKCNLCGITPELIENKKKDLEKNKILDWAKTHEKEIEYERAKILERIEEMYAQAMDDFEMAKRACPYDIRNLGYGLSDFQVDHITAIMNGGNEWDINNLQVLCVDCHKSKTKTDLKKSYKLENSAETSRQVRNWRGKHAMLSPEVTKANTFFQDVYSYSVSPIHTPHKAVTSTGGAVEQGFITSPCHIPSI